MNRNILKKIVAIVTSLTVFVWLAGPNVAQGITADELQAQIAALLAQLNQLQAQLTTLQGTPSASSACSGITFSRSLKQGLSGNDVKCLQAILNQSTDTQVAASGVGSPGNETTYFGSLTKAAVVKFQVKYAADILTPIGLTAGTGLVGAKTIVKLNTLTGGVPPGCSCTSWVTGACASGVNAGKKQQTRTCTPAACAIETQYVTDATCAIGGENKVSLAADTPAAASVAQGARDVIFAKINFCAASAANTVSKIVLKRGGIADDRDIANVKLYEGTTQIGSTQAMNTTLHTATFSSLNWTIAANSCKVLTVKASIAVADTTGLNTGDTPKFSIETASDITSTIALDGVFPVTSNAMTIAGISAGTLEVSTTTPSGGSVIAGGSDLDITGFKFTASATEAVAIHSITVTQVGSAVPSDITNIKLYYGAVQIGSTVAALGNNGKATFDLSSSPLSILVSGSKDIKVVTTIGSSVGINNRTVNFEITDSTDVTAYGSNSGGSLSIYSSSQGSTWPQRGGASTITLGSLTVDDSTAYSPSAQDYAKGTAQNSIVAFKFSAGASEAIRITQLKLKEASNTADTDFSNITLYDAETGLQLNDTAGNPVPSAGMSSGYVTFGSYTTGLDSVGLFDIDKSKNRYILVKADVPSGATAQGEYLGLMFVAPSTDIKADGLSSQNDLSSTEISPGTQKPATAILHNIISQGTLTIQASADTPAAATYAVSISNFDFAHFDFVTKGEDVTLSQLNVFFNTTTDVNATDTPAADGDVNNVRLQDGGTVLKTDSTISSGFAQFGFTLTVPKNTTKTLKVIGDIPSTSGGDCLTAQIVVDTDITASGKDSGLTIVATSSAWASDVPVHGNLMTKGAPDITVKAAPTPVATSLIKNMVDAHFATLLFTASTTESVKVTKVRVIADATDTASITGAQWDELINTTTSDGTEAIHDLVGNIKLFDGTTQIGSTVSQLTQVTTGGKYWYADFTGLSLEVPIGTTKLIDVKAKVLNNTSTSYIYFGIGTTSTDVVGVGKDSGISATFIPGGHGSAGKGMTLSAGGTLYVDADAAMPISAQIQDGTTATVGKWKFTTLYEDIKISKLVFDVFHSETATDSSSVSNATYTSAIDDAVTNFGSSTETSTDAFWFTASVNDSATTNCSFWWGMGGGVAGGATTTAELISVLGNSGSSTCASTTYTGGWAIEAELATSSTGALILYASPAGSYYSLEITDFDVAGESGNAASNTAELFLLGLKYGGTETIGKYAGSVNSVVAGSVKLYDGNTLLASAPIDTSGSPNQVIYNFASGNEILIPKATPKVLTLKFDVSAYDAAIEGSTIQFAIGTDTEAGDRDFFSNYIDGTGASSGGALASSTVLTNASTTANATTSQLVTNEMYIYRTLPTVTLNVSSPTTGSPGSSQEVLRFDVANSSSGYDLNINAIRFTLNSNTTTSVWDKKYKLYAKDDLQTVLGTGISYAYDTTTQNVGWVTIYPGSGYTIASGATKTYVLKADTSAFATAETLTVSIQPDDFYWDDGQAVNAQKKVLNLPLYGNQLKF